MYWFNPASIATLMATLLMEVLPVSAAEAPGLIFDTDICGDCDDVLALGMIHALQSRGACKLLAVTVSVDNDLAAPFVDAVNTFYGRGDIPIGVVGKGGVVEQSKYLGLVEQKETGGRFRYPHNLLSGKDAPPASQVLRKVLAAQANQSVVIAQVGFSTNLARLLDSGPDEHALLSGIDLVKRKVKLLSLMAGAFQPIDGNQNYQEYNVVRDIPSCQTLVERWPTPLVFSGFEIGIATSLPRHEHRARLPLRAAPPAGRSLHPLQPSSAQPADMGLDRRALRRARRSRLLRRFPTRPGDDRQGRIVPLRGNLARLSLVSDTPARAAAAHARGPGAAFQPASPKPRAITAMKADDHRSRDRPGRHRRCASGKLGQAVVPGLAASALPRRRIARRAFARVHDEFAE